MCASSVADTDTTLVLFLINCFKFSFLFFSFLSMWDKNGQQQEGKKSQRAHSFLPA